MLTGRTLHGGIPTMALGSQIPRPELLRTPRSYRSRRRRKRVRGLILFLILVVAAIVVWRVLKPAEKGNHELASADKTSETNNDSTVAGHSDTALNSGRTVDRTTAGIDRSRTGSRSSVTGNTGSVTRPTGDNADRHTEKKAADKPSAAGPTVSQPVKAAEKKETARPPVVAGGSPAAVRRLISRGMDSLQQGKLLEARELLNRALADPQTSESDRDDLRRTLMSINEKLVFEPVLLHDDPYMRAYTVKPGDALVKIISREGVAAEAGFLEKINQVDPRRLRPGQTIKIPTKVFHAVVHKAAYRMDIYMGDPDKPEDWMYVRSFPVGLGEYDSTPVGNWIVAPGKKMVNPDWRNPRTGEYFAANDPNNPIGERWISLNGTDENTIARSGYGIHGTIQPQSIGKSMSMGCVRMLPDDVNLVYDMLIGGKSRVIIKDR